MASVRPKLDDTVFLLGLPELCPLELAQSYSPVFVLPNENARAGTQSSRRKRAPRTLFEQTLTEIKQKRQGKSYLQLTDKVLEAYGLQTLGELIFGAQARIWRRDRPRAARPTQTGSGKISPRNNGWSHSSTWILAG